VFYSRDLVSYETRVLYLMGMVPDGWEGGDEFSGTKDDTSGGPSWLETRSWKVMAYQKQGRY